MGVAGRLQKCVSLLAETILYFKGLHMPKIPIIDKQKKPMVPSSKELNNTVPRCRPPGGKPPLPLDKSYNTQGNK